MYLKNFKQNEQMIRKWKTQMFYFLFFARIIKENLLPQKRNSYTNQRHAVLELKD